MLILRMASFLLSFDEVGGSGLLMVVGWDLRRCLDYRGRRGVGILILREYLILG